MRKENLLLYCMLCLSLIFASCTKEEVVPLLQDQCNKLGQLHAHPFTAVIKGEQIDISVDSLEGASYFWTGPNNFQSYSQNNMVSTSANYTDKGWYYVRMSYDGCDDDRFDSVYVDVKFPQGTASCSTSDNMAVFSSALILGDQSFYFISFGAVTGGYGVTANSSNGDMNITMSGYWNTHELEDGIYYTTSTALPDYADIDKVFISDVNQSIYWVAEENKPVYVTHTGGKQRIVFCGIQFSGDWGGTLYHATVDAQLTQP